MYRAGLYFSLGSSLLGFGGGLFSRSSSESDANVYINRVVVDEEARSESGSIFEIRPTPMTMQSRGGFRTARVAAECIR